MHRAPGVATSRHRVFVFVTAWNVRPASLSSHPFNCTSLDTRSPDKTRCRKCYGSHVQIVTSASARPLIRRSPIGDLN